MKDLSECRILIVDDVKENVDILVQLLRHDYKLSVALDGESALQRVARSRPDLVLLDVMMPGMDGYEVCRRLRADPETRELPIMFLTALDEVSAKTRGFEVGGTDYVTKPFEILEVSARVRSLLRAKSWADAKQEALQAEMRVAAEIQMGMVKADVGPLASQVEVAAVLAPAKDVGGDLYSVFPLDEGRLCIAVGDVSDKGVPAALFMAMTTTLLRTLVRQGQEPWEVLSRLNDELSEDNPACMFVTLFLGVLEPATGKLTCSSGGHCAPILIEPGQAPRLAYESIGTAVGLAPGIPFEPRELDLVPGASLVIYSDGVTEALDKDGALFGEERLLDHLVHAPARQARALADGLLAAVRSFAEGAPQSDDITALVLEIAMDRRC